MLTTAQLRYIDAKHSWPGTHHATWGAHGEHSANFVAIRRPSNVGGSRLWLRCACGRTVARLYFYDKWLRCRRCLRLGYQSQTVDGYTRQIWREERLRKLLPCGARRPKGMHRKTYQAIKAAIRDAQEAQDCYFAIRISPLMRRLMGGSFLTP